jgi:alpha-1,6-mannosyltransferase
MSDKLFMSKEKVFVLSITVIGLILPLFLIQSFFTRDQFFPLLICYGISFFSYVYFCHFQKSISNLTFIISLALLSRVVLFFYPPSLSDDYYRFFWDGHLLTQGENPYLLTPNEVKLNSFTKDYFQDLLFSMNSPNYHSVYPPLNQVFFAFSVYLGGQNLTLNIFLLRCVFLFFEGINFFLFIKILMVIGKPKGTLGWYALNPLVMLEGIGNLHVEVLVLTGLLGMVLAFLYHKPKWAGLSWALAVGVKLIPLLLGLAIVKELSRKDQFKFVGISMLIGCLTSGLLFISPTREGFLEGIKLFQQTFEFNASLYYLLREPIQWFLGYNPIAVLVPVLQLGMLGMVIMISLGFKGFAKFHLVEKICLIYFVYLICQPIVHPWYIIPAFGLSILTHQKIFLYWTGSIFLSYHAYSFLEVTEVGWLIFLEYGILGFALHRIWSTEK